MPLAPGGRIGPYHVTGLIGTGGMGEVYRATDTNLGRDIAIKVLPVEVAADAERLARFRREAQLLASLNHPNIAGIYGLEDLAGTPVLLLELVEGEDLAQRLARGPIPLDEALDIARRIAEALEEAHEKGIVHRDLKPANVKLAIDGKVKVLDFGLAKALTVSIASGPEAELSRSPTLVQQSGTRVGVILGTAAYMSPEQARGRAVDRRADIWAFGAVLWEMLTGRALFQGETLSDIIAAVLTREPEWAALPSATPPHIVRLLRRCLERDPRRRLQAIGEARIELERPAGDAVESAQSRSAPESRTRQPRWQLAGMIVLAAAAGVAATLMLRAGPTVSAPATHQVAFSLEPPLDHHFVGGLELSRDGRSLAFVARDPTGQTAVWVRSLDDVEPRQIAGTEGARYPFWSPDGRQIGFFAGSEMKVVDLMGGAIRSVASTTNTPDARGATWGADDVIIFAPSFAGGLLQVGSSGGTPAPATQLDAARKDGTHRWPSFLPDGRRFLFYAAKGSGTEPGELRLGTVGSSVAQTLTPSQSRGAFMPPRRVLFALGKSLMAQDLDLDQQTLVGEPVPLGIELQGSIGISGFRFLSAAGAGTLAYRQVQGDTSHIVWVNREGQELSTAVEDGGWHHLPRLAPDGRRIAVAHFSPGLGHGDIHVHDAERQLDTRVTFDDNDDEQVAWSLDGRTLAVTTASLAATEIYLVDPARPGERRLRLRGESQATADDWFPDGSLLLSVAGQGGRADLYKLPPGEGAGLVPLVVTPFSEYCPSLTADGRWLAYVGDSTGRDEVYVRALASGEEWRVSKEGGIAPLWRRDAKELFYVDPRGFIVAIPTTVGASLILGAPKALFAGFLEDATGRQYDAAPDGQRFILNRRKETVEKPIVIMTGLPAEPAATKRP